MKVHILFLYFRPLIACDSADLCACIFGGRSRCTLESWIASGVSTITEEGGGMTWLVERKRPTTVIKFSGTLVHTSARRDLCSLTICPFAHFVYGYGGGKIVFADLQGKYHQALKCVRGGDGLIQFDLMTHTKGGNSGVGDFGDKGIATFVRDHKCNMICSRLELV
ncbi:kinase-like domain-containing protein [Mycena vulgaris]|nr:kinase-like domain-containing protein [Mycena vulgaris]